MLNKSLLTWKIRLGEQSKIKRDDKLEIKILKLLSYKK